MQSTLQSSEGILLVDKPRGWTSFSLIHLLRKHTKIRKIGHAGTLDPFASGVMVLLVGKSYTKLSDTFLSKEKEYQAEILLGKHSNTYDLEGTLEEVSTRIPTHDEVTEVLQTFQGTIEQIPPMFSAKKIGGQKLYHLARRGIEMQRPPVQVSVCISDIVYQYPYLHLRVKCSKGTYIRSLAYDIGKALQVGGVLSNLVRTRSGSYQLKDCIDGNLLKNSSFEYRPHLLT